jgi:hypothetical protein
MEAYESRYRDEIRYVDLHIARLVSGADALGPRPWVVLTADHAEAFGEDGYYFAHGHSVGMDQIRVPLLVRPAESGPGRTSAYPVSGVDVAPTLLRAAGLSVPETFHGAPLPLYDGDERENPRTLVAEHRARVALVVGEIYYARDRYLLRPGTQDEITGGALVPLPPRVARLNSDGRLPEYRSAADESVALLEPMLARFLRSITEAEARSAKQLTEAEREALDALGYLE